MTCQTDTTRELQNEVLQILQYVDHICRRESLTYYLAYGTLLGAVRHKGFIPWDDDIDLWMPRNDYMKLLDFLHRNQENRFILSAGKYKPKGDRPEQLQMRVIDTKIKIQHSFSAGEIIECYPWIDIFALDVYPMNKKHSYLNTFKRELFVYKIARAKNYLIKERSLLGMMNYVIYYLHNHFGLFKRVLNEEKHIEKALKAITKYDSQNVSENYSVFCYAAVYLSTLDKCLFEREWFGKAKELEFENIKFFVPSDYDAILKKIYNDYMKLPPKDQRVNTHHAKLIYQEKQIQTD